MSLLWKTAVDQGTEPDEYISHQDLAKMYSGDFDSPMSGVKKDLQEDWDSQNGGHPSYRVAHPKDLEHGGPTNYIEHLKQDIAQNGMREPLVIRGGNVVTEGHHRGAVALDLKMDKIPVRHIR